MSDELMAVLEVMAYGYDVTVTINGSDVGIKGGKSEGTRLMGKDDPMVAEMPAEMRNLACLRSGKNEVVVAYRRRKEEDSTGLTVEIKAAGKDGGDVNVYRHREDPSDDPGAKKVTGTFTL
jgi:hypothetical protein